MCDYSLMSVPNRLATQGEELVTHRFLTGAIGLASPTELAPQPDIPHPRKTFWSILKELFAPPKTERVAAVCIPPGARLVLQDIPQLLQEELAVGPAEQVAFTQLSAAAYSYRDGVRFQNGREVLLQHLHEGQRVLVVELSVPETFEPVWEEIAAR